MFRCDRALSRSGEESVTFRRRNRPLISFDEWRGGALPRRERRPPPRCDQQEQEAMSTFPGDASVDFVKQAPTDRLPTLVRTRSGYRVFDPALIAGTHY